MKFGKRSLEKLETCDYALQYIVREALAYGLMDFSVIEGFRDEEKQNEYFKAGKSKVRFPNGKHNQHPSKAVDAVPYINGKISWDHRHCIYLAGVIQAAAKKLGYDLRWGGNWDMDGEPVTDQDFQDLVHFELIGG